MYIAGYCLHFSFNYGLLSEINSYIFNISAESTFGGGSRVVLSITSPWMTSTLGRPVRTCVMATECVCKGRAPVTRDIQVSGAVTPATSCQQMDFFNIISSLQVPFFLIRALNILNILEFHHLN